MLSTHSDAIKLVNRLLAGRCRVLTTPIITADKARQRLRDYVAALITDLVVRQINADGRIACDL